MHRYHPEDHHVLLKREKKKRKCNSSNAKECHLQNLVAFILDFIVPSMLFTGSLKETSVETVEDTLTLCDNCCKREKTVAYLWKDCCKMFCFTYLPCSILTKLFFFFRNLEFKNVDSITSEACCQIKKVNTAAIGQCLFLCVTFLRSRYIISVRSNHQSSTILDIRTNICITRFVCFSLNSTTAYSTI